MKAEKIVYHLVTRTPMRKGQIINFGDNGSTNTLYGFFFEKEIKNSNGEDFFQVLEKNTKDNQITLKEEDTRVALKYAGITIRAIRETILEMVRLKEFPEMPSRLSCLYAARDLEEAMKWKTVFESFNREVLQIVKLRAEGKYFEGDGDLLPKANGQAFSQKIEQAREYWKGNGKSTLPEVLIDGHIEVTEIVEEFLSN